MLSSRALKSFFFASLGCSFANRSNWPVLRASSRLMYLPVDMCFTYWAAMLLQEVPLIPMYI